LLLSDLGIHETQSLEEILKTEKLAVEDDPLQLLWNAYFKIKAKCPDKEIAPIIPFSPNVAQTKLLDLIISCKKQDIPPWIWVPKARRKGVSTLSSLLIYAMCSQKIGVNGCIVADDDPGASYLLDMCKLTHDKFSHEYEHLAPYRKRSNRKELVFSHIDSQIQVDTARNINAGRKYNYQYVLFSEVSIYPRPEELFGGFLDTITRHSSTILIGESTCRGIGNYFYNEVMKAHNGKSSWQLLFLPFFMDDDAKLRVTERHAKFIERTLTPEEKNLLEIHKVTYGNLWWRRDHIINVCHGINLADEYGMLQPDETDESSMDWFHQENPSNLQEAFVDRGRVFFSTRLLNEMQLPRELKPGEKLEPGITFIRGELSEVDGKFYLLPCERGQWQFFELPEQGVNYCCGVDCAEGVEIVEFSGKRDWHVISIRRQDTLAQVAVYRSQISPIDLAYEIMKAGYCYNGFIVGVERNNTGNTVILKLKEIYPYIFVEERFDERLRKRVNKLGWHTNTATRRPLLDSYDEALRNKTIKIRSENGVHECKTFITYPTGEPKAASGCHDDEVFADAICLMMHKLIARSYKKKSEQEDIFEKTYEPQLIRMAF
jgi:hypothetical protein